MTMTTMLMKAPFPYFGAKSRIANEVWARFGNPDNYVEPFFGSGAVLLARPHPAQDRGIETVNDLDGLLANFWRSVQFHPDAVAEHASWPMNEADLHARHLWLVGQRERITERLVTDPDWCDPKAAGWWVWGICSWISSGWCSGDGPWTAERFLAEASGSGVEQAEAALGDAGLGVRRKLPQLGPERGVHRKRPHLSSRMGVHRQRPHLFRMMGVHRNLPELASGRGECEASLEALVAWMRALADRLRRVRVCCGDWTRVLGPTPTTTLGTTAVFLDPPYAVSERERDLYVQDSDVSAAVREWALASGDNPLLRIALCGYDGEHEMPASWEVLRWEAHGGYGRQGNGRGRENAQRETVWFSPHCLRPLEYRQLSLFAQE